MTGYGQYPYQSPNPPPPPPYPDRRNQTEQTQVGPYLGLCTTASGQPALNYQIDTAPGNSGSPVFLPATDIAFGIHTNGLSVVSGTCRTTPFNLGTPSTNADFLAALTNAVKGTNGAAIFVDFAQPTTDPVGTGTPLNPYRDLATAAANAAAGQATVLNLAPGHYAPNGIAIAANAAAGSVIILGTSAGTIGIGPYPRAGP